MSDDDVFIRRALSVLLERTDSPLYEDYSEYEGRSIHFARSLASFIPDHSLEEWLVKLSGIMSSLKIAKDRQFFLNHYFMYNLFYQAFQEEISRRSSSSSSSSSSEEEDDIPF